MNTNEERLELIKQTLLPYLHPTQFKQCRREIYFVRKVQSVAMTLHRVFSPHFASSTSYLAPRTSHFVPRISLLALST